MKIYEQITGKEEASGAVFLGYITAMGPFKPMAEMQLKKAGIDKVELSGSYQRQVLLDILKKMDAKGGSKAVFQMGKEMAAITEIPEGIADFETFMLATPQVYPIYNTNLDSSKDFMKVEKTGTKELKMTYNTPYPGSAIEGFTTRIYRKFEGNSNIKFSLLEGNSDDFNRVYKITW